VELIELFAILGVFIPVFLVVIWQLNRANPGRKAQKAGSDGVSTMYNVYNQQVQDVLKVKDKQIASLSQKLRNFEEEPEGEEPEVANLIKNPEIQKLLQQKGVNPAILENPVIQKLVKKYTKGMNIEDILAIAQQFGLLKGNQQSKGGVIGTPEGYNPNWA